MMVRQGFATSITAQTHALTRLRDEVENNAQRAISGLEVQKPSDAAGQWSHIQQLEDRLRDQSVYTRNAQTAQATLGVAEGALAQGTNLLAEARALAVQLSNDVVNDDDRADMVGRIEGIRDSLIGLANIQFAGRSVFAGTASDQPAYSSSGVYLGNGDTSTIVVADGQSVRSSFAGDAVFDEALQVLDDFAAALASGPGSADAVAAQLDGLDSSRQALIRTRQQVGFEVLDAEDAATLADSLQLSLQEAVNNHLAADPVEALTALSESQSAYEVALQVTASVSSTTLFDFLR